VHLEYFETNGIRTLSIWSYHLFNFWLEESLVTSGKIPKIVCGAFGPPAFLPVVVTLDLMGKQGQQEHL